MKKDTKKEDKALTMDYDEFKKMFLGDLKISFYTSNKEEKKKMRNMQKLCNKLASEIEKAEFDWRVVRLMVKRALS